MHEGHGCVVLMLFWRHNKSVFELVDVRAHKVAIAMLKRLLTFVDEVDFSVHTFFSESCNEHHSIANRDEVSNLVWSPAVEDAFHVFRPEEFAKVELINVSCLGSNDKHVQALPLVKLVKLFFVDKVELLHVCVVEELIWNPLCEVFEVERVFADVITR